ncbi:killer cell lectin-like receptor subfamily G member 1 [Corapipo altera]|uniref:killer cell lectin-like receptor subfamily G member 1 n=1 Tax=Corapipo altera TaxID=415028 RepID=UPI000FD626B1|nr:killer cell lectin-like receptor subfamily G member 1 [Corapipo altera]XP_027488126.1 killer cell lectin-like receptor subfamily G member 1 [Corapipo altera]XP_027488182.1 killer cell lectin-like receptor subfamily G member 1 [Corapipo altera]XP_027488248.1 killer cell lectin-like receptor subfamily G member 1 [Corapipo altera]
MEGSRSETSAADMSEEVTYTSVRFSQASPPRAEASQEKRDPHLWSAVVLGLAIGFGILSTSLVIALIWKMNDSYPHCPEEWVAYRGSCYSFSKEEKDWNSSQVSCWSQRAHLLVVSDTREMDLFKRIQTECFWIGLRNSTSSGWIWEDGSISNYTKVLSNSHVQHCAVLMKGHFHASSCEFRAPWICEKSLR